MNKQQKTFAALIIIAATVYIYMTYDLSSDYVLQQIRFPRFMLTLLTGMVLGSIGYCFQLLLNNPLAEPYILGVSSGAALFSILAGSLGFYLLMPVAGFAGALITMLIVYWLARQGGGFNLTRLLLAGIIIGMFISAIISLVMYLNQDDIGNIINVLMGNLGHIFSQQEWNIFLIVFTIVIILLIYLFLQGRKLLIISTGDLTAVSLGIDVNSFRKRIFVICSLLTGVTVAFSGIIGFVGLIIPHLVRLIWKGNKPESMFYAGIFGAVFLLWCDFLAMHITIIELPVGIVTAFIGCPLFIYLLWQKK